ncbi:MAG: hypothetical protein J0H59_06905 [Comamonadaceae bacterium]|nr:hypothetical protein [Comamonadaceae bacterium]
MKRHLLSILAFACLGLAVLLAGLWINRQGQWRNTHWQAPVPLTTNYLEMLPLLPEPARVPTSRFMALLERPLFSETRRPPPPPPPPAPPVPVDVLSNAQLSAIYAGEQLTGVIINVNGKNRRVRLNESVDGWVLRSVQGRVATFDYGGQQRQLQLMRAKVGTSAGGKPLNAAPAPAEAMAPAPAAVPLVPEAAVSPPPVAPQEAASSTPARRPRFGP